MLGVDGFQEFCMQVTCPACSTKYSLPDEKVRGRRVRITCKRCASPIIADGTHLSAEGAVAGAKRSASAPPSSLSSGSVASLPGSDLASIHAPQPSLSPQVATAASTVSTTRTRATASSAPAPLATATAQRRPLRQTIIGVAAPANPPPGTGHHPAATPSARPAATPSAHPAATPSAHPPATPSASSGASAGQPSAQVAPRATAPIAKRTAKKTMIGGLQAAPGSAPSPGLAASPSAPPAVRSSVLPPATRSAVPPPAGRSSLAPPATRSAAPPAAAPAPAQWSVALSAQYQPTLGLAEIQAALADGRATAATLVWREGMNNWQALGEVEQLAPLLAASAARLPSQPPPESVRQTQRHPLDDDDDITRLVPSLLDDSEADFSRPLASPAAGLREPRARQVSSPSGAWREPGRPDVHPPSESEATVSEMAVSMAAAEAGRVFDTISDGRVSPGSSVAPPEAAPKPPPAERIAPEAAVDLTVPAPPDPAAAVAPETPTVVRPRRRGWWLTLALVFLLAVTIGASVATHRPAALWSELHQRGLDTRLDGAIHSLLRWIQNLSHRLGR